MVKPTREELVALLVKHNLRTLQDYVNSPYWVEEILRNGFAGYNSFTTSELYQEAAGLELIDREDDE